MGFQPPWLPKKECTTDHDIQALPPNFHSSNTVKVSLIANKTSIRGSNFLKSLTSLTTLRLRQRRNPTVVPLRHDNMNHPPLRQENTNKNMNKNTNTMIPNVMPLRRDETTPFMPLRQGRAQILANNSRVPR